MAIIPTVRCRQLSASIAFYTRVLDFTLADGAAENDPAFCVLMRGNDPLFLSSHAGDGEFGQAIAVVVDDLDEIYRTLLARGLKLPGNPDSPVHQGPTHQSWGTREFYVDDPDGNTLRFVQQRS